MWGFTPATSDGLVGLTYYAFWMVLLAAAVVLAIRAFDDESPLSAADRGDGARTACHRSARELFPAAGQPESASWRCGDSRCCARRVDRREAPRGEPLRRARSTTAVPVALAACICAAAASYGDVGRRLDQSGLTRSWEKTAERFTAVSDSLRRLPPKDWSGFEREDGFRRQPGMSPNARPRTITSSWRPRLPRFMSLRIAGLPRGRRRWRWASTHLRTISGARWRG